MIYVTGDIHANPKRLGMDALAQRGIHMNPEDYVIVCGDFGIPWVGESPGLGNRMKQIISGWNGWRSCRIRSCSSTGIMKTLTNSAAIR